MNRVASLAVLFVAVFGSASAFADWVEVDGTEAGFTGKFPGKPVANQQGVNTPMGELTMRFYQYADADTKAVTSVIHTPFLVEIDKDVSKEVLDGLQQGFCGELQAVVSSSKDLMVQGSPAREIAGEFQKNGEPWNLRLLLVLRGKDSYQIVAVAPKRTVDISNYADPLFKNFKLIKK